MTQPNDANAPKSIERRKMLARIGLAAGVAYTAPTLLHLTPAHASGVSGPSGAGGTRTRGGTSRPSRPSRPGDYGRGRVSRPSRPERHGGGHQHRTGGEAPRWLLRLLGQI